MVPPSKSLKVLPALPSSAVTTVFFVALIATFLFVAREVLIPIALAILLSFVLSPVVRLLQRLHFPRSLSVISVVVVAFGGIFPLGSLPVAQVDQLATDLPSSRTNLTHHNHR